MSRYVVSGYDKRMRIMVGFSRDYGYWFVGHEEGVDRAVMQSDPDAIKTLHELVRSTWGGRRLDTRAVHASPSA